MSWYFKSNQVSEWSQSLQASPTTPFLHSILKANIVQRILFCNKTQNNYHDNFLFKIQLICRVVTFDYDMTTPNKGAKILAELAITPILIGTNHKYVSVSKYIRARSKFFPIPNSKAVQPQQRWRKPNSTSTSTATSLPHHYYCYFIASTTPTLTFLLFNHFKPKTWRTRVLQKLTFGIHSSNKEMATFKSDGLY